MKTLRERFNEKVDRSGGPGSCWEWTAGKNEHGYGRIYDQCTRYAHHIAWELFRGPIPAGNQVLHRCDNRGCVRPDHLFLGTNADNQRDKKEKGRAAKGTDNGRAKLNPTKVRKIRRLIAEGNTKMGVAREFEVDTKAIYKILSRETWDHVE